MPERGRCFHVTKLSYLNINREKIDDGRLEQSVNSELFFFHNAKTTTHIAATFKIWEEKRQGENTKKTRNVVSPFFWHISHDIFQRQILNYRTAVRLNRSNHSQKVIREERTLLTLPPHRRLRFKKSDT